MDPVVGAGWSGGSDDWEGASLEEEPPAARRHPNRAARREPVPLEVRRVDGAQDVVASQHRLAPQQTRRVRQRKRRILQPTAHLTIHPEQGERRQRFGLPPPPEAKS